jgi:hypothetical protein
LPCDNKCYRQDFEFGPWKSSGQINEPHSRNLGSSSSPEKSSRFESWSGTLSTRSAQSLETQPCRIHGSIRPIHLLEPSNDQYDLSAWDGVTEFISRQRNCLAEGWTESVVFGTAEVDLDSIFTSKGSDPSPANVSGWVANLLQPFDDLGVPERLGLMLLLGRLLTVYITL